MTAMYSPCATHQLAEDHLAVEAEVALGKEGPHDARMSLGILGDDGARLVGRRVIPDEDLEGDSGILLQDPVQRPGRCSARAGSS